MEIVKHSYKWANALKRRAKTEEIILHCAATPEGREVTTDAIHRAHLGRAFAGIGYNYVIYLDGSIHEGRPAWAAGAHATNHNSKSVGVCYIGGVAADGKTAKDTRTEAQKVALYKLVKELMLNYGLGLNAVHAHYEFANKACPSFSIAKFKEEFKNYFGIK